MKAKSFAPPGCADPAALLASLSRDVACVATQRSVSFDVSYPEFLRYFRDADVLTRHHVIIAANFAYGWMPTILKSLANDLEFVIQALQHARDGELLTAQQIDTVSKAINGSIVGASKVLHFAAPPNYAIWDSRVATYLGTTTQRSVAGLAQYMAYNEPCRTMASMPRAEVITQEVRRVVDENATTMRALELVMYCAALENRTYVSLPSAL
jgi:hypothetical protein